MALPPATSGIFSFAGDSLFVESSGKNLHRRSTIPELKAHFDASADRPAHWYEAQLIHYGLPSSRVKGTAKMRLYDAVKGKGLAVPGHMKTMEADLKKLWKKQGKGGQEGVIPAPVAPSTNKRKANAGGEAPVAKASKKNATSTPRKTTASKTSTALSTNATSEAAPPTPTPTTQPRPKQTARRGGKAPQARAPAAEPVPEVETPAAPPRAKQTARRAGSAAAAAPRTKQTARGGGAAAARVVADIPSVTVAPEQPQAAPKTKQTARRGGSTPARRGGAATAPPAAGVQFVTIPSAAFAPEETPQRAPRTKQTARRSVGFRAGAPLREVAEASPASVTPGRKPQMARRGGHHPAPARGNPSNSDNTDSYQWSGEPAYPKKKSESPCSPGPFAYEEMSRGTMGFGEDGQDAKGGAYDVDMDDDNDNGPAPPLGLLNGRYEVYAEPRDEWTPGDTLILTLDGDNVWAHLESENLTAMLLIRGRPYEAPSGPLGAHCRCRVSDEYGLIRVFDARCAPSQGMDFLGGGRVRVVIRYGYGRDDYREFKGVRVSGRETRSEVSPWEMRQRWEGIVSGN